MRPGLPSGLTGGRISFFSQASSLSSPPPRSHSNTFEHRTSHSTLWRPESPRGAYPSAVFALRPLSFARQRDRFPVSPSARPQMPFSPPCHGLRFPLPPSPPRLLTRDRKLPRFVHAASILNVQVRTYGERLRPNPPTSHLPPPASHLPPPAFRLLLVALAKTRSFRSRHGRQGASDGRVHFGRDPEAIFEE